MLKTQIRIYLGDRNYKITLDTKEIWIFREDSDMNIALVKTVKPVNSYEDFVTLVEVIEDHYKAEGDFCIDVNTIDSIF